MTLWSAHEMQCARPPERLTVSEWADKHRILLHQTSPEPGPWRTSRAPYLKGIMDAFSDPAVERIILCKPAQTGGTESIYNMLGFVIAQDPAPTLMVMPTVELAEYVSRNRIQPMIEAVLPLRERKDPVRDNFTLLEMGFAGMVLSLAGANSAASLATRPVRYLFLDEVDKYPAFAGKEADPISLAEERTKNFWNRKIVLISTPTLEAGNVWTALQNAQVVLEYCVPCPLCGHLQALVFDNLKFERDEALPRLVTSAWYECAGCGERIGERDRMKAVSQGLWLTEEGRERPPGIHEVGFHFNALVSPWTSFKAISEKFLSSKDAPESLQNFRNSWLALPWVEDIVEKMTEDVFALKQDYAPGEVPEEALLLTAGADIGKDFFHFVIRAWSRTDSWLIREGIVQNFEDLVSAIFGTTYRMPSRDRIIPVSKLCIDAGFRTDEVYEFARRDPRRISPTKGATHAMKNLRSPTRLDYYADGRPMPGGLILWLFDTGHWKDWVVRRMQGTEEAGPSWFVHKEISGEYALQVTAEHKVTTRNKKTKRTTTRWEVKSGRPNHYFDAEVLAAVAADMCGLKFLSATEPSGEPRDPQQTKKSLTKKLQWLGDRRKRW